VVGDIVDCDFQVMRYGGVEVGEFALGEVGELGGYFDA